MAGALFPVIAAIGTPSFSRETFEDVVTKRAEPA